MITNKCTEILRPWSDGPLQVRHCNGRPYTYAVGSRVGVTTYVATPEGGYAQSYTYTTVESLGHGTEANMLGNTTALAVVDVGGEKRTIPCRLLDVYA